jgi:glycosyltransferase involved in cell wall biosynthesis
LVLWRIRKMFAEFPREYELIVFNDGSTDATAEVLAPYAERFPSPFSVAAITSGIRARSTRCSGLPSAAAGILVATR